VHIFGYPVDLLALEGIADAYEIPILEDACQALGAVDAEGRQVGSTGHVTTFAFYANKQLTTGEGGVLVPPPAEEEMVEAVRSERNQGRSSDMTEVDHVRIGFNYRMTDIQAALGLAQLERLDEMLAARAEAAAAYNERLKALGGAPAGDGDPDGLVLPCTDRGDEQRSWFVYVVQLPSGAERGAVIEALAAAGIQSKAYLPCIHTMPPYRERFGFKGGEFPVAERVAKRSLALPFFASITEEQVERVCTALVGALDLP
jgi:perosamine synthetase